MPVVDENDKDDLKQQLNLETGKVAWKELAPHFARGSIVISDARLDLIEVAACFVRDDKTQLEQWLNNGMVRRANDDDARQWSKRDSLFWAVVTAPWVIVQEAVEN